MLGPDLPHIQVWLQRQRAKAVRAAIKMFQLIKEEERRTFPERSYFKLNKEHPEDIPEFDNDKKIEAKKTDTTNTTSDRGLEFAEHPHEI